MNKSNYFRAIIAMIALAFSIAINANADPVSPVQTSDTLYCQPIKSTDPSKGNRIPGKHVYAFVTTTGNEMQIEFSQPVSCEIQMVDMEGQPALTARMREEDIAILDVSRLHGRFQLIIRSDRWFATKAYWFS